MESLFNVYFAGEILEGYSLDGAREKLGTLFNTDETTLQKLFSGQPQLLKRNCNKATALQYQQAIESAGAKPIIRAANAPAPEPRIKPAPAADTSQKISAAQRIAALAQAPDNATYGREPAPATEPEPDDEPAEGLYLAAVGSNLLRPSERAEPITSEVDTTNITLGTPTDRLTEASAPPPPAPDTRHLSVASAGEDIPTLPSDAVPLDPNTDALNLAPEGTDFADCAAPAVQRPEFDLSDFSVESND